MAGGGQHAQQVVLRSRIVLSSTDGKGDSVLAESLGSSASTIEAIVEATLRTKPKGATHWICRTMARQQGVGKATTIDHHPRFLPHFIPTSSSCLNMVERWFALISSAPSRRFSRLAMRTIAFSRGPPPSIKSMPSFRVAGRSSSRYGSGAPRPVRERGDYLEY